MEYKDGSVVSGYTANDILVEGVVKTNEQGDKVILTEDFNWAYLSEMKIVKLVEEDEETKALQARVDDDINNLDLDKISSVDDKELEKIGSDREKELKSAGMKFNDGDYASRFISGVKAKTTQDEVDAGIISVSTALEKYKNSKQVDLEARLHKALRESDIFDNIDEDIENDIIEQTLTGHSEFGLADDRAQDAIEEAKNLLELEDEETVKEYLVANYEIADDEADRIISEAQSIEDDDILSDDESFNIDIDNEDDDSPVLDMFNDTDEDTVNDVYDDIEEEELENTLSEEKLEDEITDQVESEIESVIDDYEQDADIYDEMALYERICDAFNYKEKLNLLKEANNVISEAVLLLRDKIVESRK